MFVGRTMKGTLVTTCEDLEAGLLRAGEPPLLEWAARFPRASVAQLVRQLPVKTAAVWLVLAMACQSRRRDFAGFVGCLAGHCVAEVFMEGATWSHAEWLFLLAFEPEQTASAEGVWSRVRDAFGDGAGADASTLGASGAARLPAIFHGLTWPRAPGAEELDEVDALLGRTSSTQELERLPVGYAWLAALRVLDAEVRNGGFSQLHENGLKERSRPVAELLRVMGEARAAAVVEAALAEMERPHGPRATRLRALSQEYGCLVTDGAARALALRMVREQRDALFPAYRELRHPQDGRLFRARCFGARLEIEVVDGDGDRVIRTREVASRAGAQSELDALLLDLARDGFVAREDRG